METTLQLILDELKTMNQRMDSMENRMGSMEQNLSDLTEQVKENTLFIHALINGQHKLEQKIDSSIDFMQNLAVRTTTLEHVTGKILYNLADDRR
ncbi:MAG: hypothetical protein II239_08525 [Peptococcaceae bacterium]|nr:hypothetical protein [Peptococcaceae bacterium]